MLTLALPHKQDMFLLWFSWKWMNFKANSNLVGRFYTCGYYKRKSFWQWYNIHCHHFFCRNQSWMQMTLQLLSCGIYTWYLTQGDSFKSKFYNLMSSFRSLYKVFNISQFFSACSKKSIIVGCSHYFLQFFTFNI